MTMIERLRLATDDDVEAALEGAYVSLPLTDTAQALEFIQRMVDVLTGKDGASGTDAEQTA